jgi:hypothetical protein
MVCWWVLVHSGPLGTYTLLYTPTHQGLGLGLGLASRHLDASALTKYNREGHVLERIEVHILPSSESLWGAMFCFFNKFL